MAYLAISYPNLSQADHQWIQEYREKNDPRYFDLVEPHFTLVFPTFDIAETDFVSEIKKQSEGVQSFNFACNVATVNFDSSGSFYHEFLVPDQGYSDIVKLHDKLYSGTLAKNLRLDIDFIPHIGIGNTDESTESKQRVDTINTDGVSIAGSIDSIDIVKYENDLVQTVEKIQL